MKAVIMAGGEGRRLHPLTETKPKPLVSVMNRPIMDGIIKTLADLGIREAAVTTMYLAEQIEAEFGDRRHGVALRYFRETSPLGTAGSVKNAEEFLDEDFIVISGDCLCDMRLQNAIHAHYDAGADCTMVLAETDLPLEFGVVVRDRDGRITAFVEKPGWNDVPSDLVNTGIYIINRAMLAHIPPGRSYDFGRDFFPALLERGYRLNGHFDGGYWCDVGSPDAYYKGNFDAKSGKLPGVYGICGASCALGEGVSIAPDARVQNCIIGDHTAVREGAALSGCILGRGCEIGSGVRAENCIIDDRARVGENTRLEPGSIIGADSVLEANVSLCGKSKVVSGSHIEPNDARCERALFYAARDELFSDGRMDAMPPDQAMRLGYAASLGLKENIGILFDESRAAELTGGAFSCGVVSGGTDCLSLGVGTPAGAAWAALELGATVFHFAKHGVSVFEGDSLPAGRAAERKILARLDDAILPTEYLGSVKYIDGVLYRYREALKKELAGADLGKAGIRVDAAETGSALLAELRISPCGENPPLVFSVSSGGELSLTAGGERTFDFDHLRALLIHDMGSKEIDIPADFPAVFDGIAEQNGASLRRYSRETGVDPERVREFFFLRDPEWCLIRTALLFGRLRGSVPKLLEAFDKLPPFYIARDELRSEELPTARIMRTLSERDGRRTGGGVVLTGDKGSVRIAPSGKNSLRIYAEAHNFEAAEELFDFARLTIRQKERFERQ